MDDAALVLAARSGDRDALAAIYDRYGDRLHDYCWSILRDRDEAADAFHDAFCIAAQRLDQLREPSKLRPWLYAIARHEALRRATARRRQQPTEDLGDVMSAEPELDASSRQEEAVQLVWAAAAGLSERDRALLDLNVRQGLEGQELAEAIGVEPDHAYVLLSRLRDQVERSLGALLVARYGRSDCPELATILQGWDGTFSPLLRKRVARHTDGCDVCADRRRSLASPLALLSAVPLVPAPAHLRDKVLGDAQLVAFEADVGTAPRQSRWSGRGGFPPPLYPSRPGGRAGAAAAAAAAAVLILVALGLLLGKPFADDTDDKVSVAAVATTPSTLGAGTGGTSTTTIGPSIPGSSVTTGGGASSPGSSSPGTQVPATVAGPGVQLIGPQLRLDATALDFGASGSEQVLVLANDGDVALAWSASTTSSAFSTDSAGGEVAAGAEAQVTVFLDRSGAPEGPLEAALEVTSDGGDAGVGLSASVVRPPVVQVSIDDPVLARTPCRVQPTATSIQAGVSDESGIAWVVLHWVDPSGAAGSADLAGGSGGTWLGRLGPYATAGAVTWWVEASDSLGAVGRSADQSTPVEPCA
jgi:RNA polymerase sigma factor (sigma-70 family)